MITDEEIKATRQLCSRWRFCGQEAAVDTAALITLKTPDLLDGIEQLKAKLVALSRMAKPKTKV